VGEDNTRSSKLARHAPQLDNAVADRTCRLIAAASDDRCSRSEPGGRRSLSGHYAGDVGRFVQGRKNVAIDVSASTI
jgi:hypothetical protein